MDNMKPIWHGTEAQRLQAIATIAYIRSVARIIPDPVTSDCACQIRSATNCWALRYDIDPMDVELDGGPCLCACHDGCDDD